MPSLGCGCLLNFARTLRRCSHVVFARFASKKASAFFKLSETGMVRTFNADGSMMVFAASQTELGEGARIYPRILTRGCYRCIQIIAESNSGYGALTSASSSVGSLFARQEARTDLDLASQKIHKSSRPLQMPFAPPLVGFGRDPEFRGC